MIRYAGIGTESCEKCGSTNLTVRYVGEVKQRVRDNGWGQDRIVTTSGNLYCECKSCEHSWDRAPLDTPEEPTTDTKAASLAVELSNRFRERGQYQN